MTAWARAGALVLIGQCWPRRPRSLAQMASDLQQALGPSVSGYPQASTRQDLDRHMTELTFALVLLAATFHALWNFAAKKVAGNLAVWCDITERRVGKP